MSPDLAVFGRVSVFIDGASSIDAAAMLRDLVQSGAGDIRAGPLGLLAYFDTPSAALVAAIRLSVEFSPARRGLGIGIDANDPDGHGAHVLARLGRSRGVYLSARVASLVSAPKRWVIVPASQHLPPETAEIAFELVSARARVPTNLPRPVTSFVGREEDLATVSNALATHFMVAITGPPGSGKTRFAHELGEDLLGVYPDGVYSVPLHGVLRQRDVLHRLAATLGVADANARGLKTSIARHLAGNRLLLILDEADNALPTAPLVEELLGTPPLTRVLITSRVASSRIGAREYRLDPLPVPYHGERHPSTEELRRLPSTRLFVERASATRSRFELDTRTAPVVAEICRRLDGLPLAIELAASRLQHIPAQTLLDGLDRDLGAPGNHAAAQGSHHRSLATAIDSSYGVLTPLAQRIFRRLCVFRGGFTTEAAVAVCSGPDVKPGTVTGVIETLVDRSLVQPPREQANKLRYAILEPLRQFGMQKLVDTGELDATRLRHASHFAQVAELPGAIVTGESRDKAEAISRDKDNLHSALEWAVAHKDAATAASIALGTLPLWVHTGTLGEGRAWIEATETLAASLPAHRRAETWLIHGLLCQWQGDWRAATRSQKQAVEAAIESGTMALIATTQTLLAQAAVQADDDEAAHLMVASVAADESLAVAREIGDQLLEATCLFSAALVAMRREAIGDSEDKLVAAARLYRESEDRGASWSRAIVLKLIGMIRLYRQNDVQAALGVWRESLVILRDVGTPWAAAWLLDDFSAAAARLGDQRRANTLAGAAARHASAYGTTLSSFARWANAGPGIAHAPAPESDAWHEGQRMSLDEAIDYALHHDAPMTPRQRAGLTVGALGPLRVSGLGGTITDWGGPKAGSRQAQAIFGFLFDRGDHGVAKDEFVELIWPDADISHADVALHRTLLGLRTTLAQATGLPRGEVIRFERDRYRLGPQVVESSDVAEFFDEWTWSGAAGDDHEALRSGEAARALVRGDFLEDCPFYGDSAFVEERRRAVRERLRDLLITIAEVYEARGQLDLARERYRDALRASGGTDRRALEGIARIGITVRR